MLYFKVHDTTVHSNPLQSTIHSSPRSTFVYDAIWSTVPFSGPGLDSTLQFMIASSTRSTPVQFTAQSTVYSNLRDGFV